MRRFWELLQRSFCWRRRAFRPPELTAAFLFNFVKFTTWPADVLRDGGSPIVVCVSGDDRVADSLVQLTREKMVEGHPLVGAADGPRQPLDECHVVYGAALNLARAQRVDPRGVRSSDPYRERLEDFAERGGWRTSSWKAAGYGLR